MKKLTGTLFENYTHPEWKARMTDINKETHGQPFENIIQAIISDPQLIQIVENNPTEFMRQKFHDDDETDSFIQVKELPDDVSWIIVENDDSAVYTPVEINLPGYGYCGYVVTNKDQTTTLANNQPPMV